MEFRNPYKDHIIINALMTLRLWGLISTPARIWNRYLRYWQARP